MYKTQLYQKYKQYKTLKPIVSKAMLTNPAQTDSTTTTTGLCVGREEMKHSDVIMRARAREDVAVDQQRLFTLSST